MKNFRAAPVIKHRFSGELLEEGVYSVNKRNELTWRVERAAGEEHKRTNKYQVLVDN